MYAVHGPATMANIGYVWSSTFSVLRRCQLTPEDIGGFGGGKRAMPPKRQKSPFAVLN